MEKFARLVARRDHRYAGRLRRIGTTYTALERHARLLILTKRAQRDPAEPVPETHAAEPVAHPLTPAEVHSLVAEAARSDDGPDDDAPTALDRIDESVEQPADDSASGASIEIFPYLRDD